LSTTQFGTRRTVLVVSDRYPPDSHGGAELSLHITLRQIQNPSLRIVVAAFVDPERPKSRDMVDGMEVHRVPLVATWPPTASWPIKPAGTRAELWRNRAISALETAKYLSGPGPRPLRERLDLIRLRRSISRQRVLGHFFPLIDADMIEMSGTLAVLQSVVDEVRPSVIHADNYRAILFVHRLKAEGAYRSALVRDNRFFCAQRDQPMNIEGVICQSCSMQCVGQAPDPIPRLATRFMQESLDVRRRALASFDRICATSRFLCDELGRVLPERSIRCIPNPSDDPEFVRSAQGSIAPSDPPILLCVGMINRSKGQFPLVEQLPLIRERFGKVVLQLAGRGNLELTRLQRRAAQLGVGDMIEPLGYLDRRSLYEVYARSSIVVCPTIWPEPFGRVPLEAGLSGKPIVSFAVGGLKESIEDGRTGYLVPPGDWDGFVDSIGRLLDDPALRKQMGAEASKKIREAYPPETSSAKFQALWLELLDNDNAINEIAFDAST
jgi:glycosyltransferase involved in cell wall biosynthesis